MSDLITLPREVAEYLMEILEESPHHGDWSERDCVALDTLRARLAAPEPEPCKEVDAAMDASTAQDDKT